MTQGVAAPSIFDTFERDYHGPAAHSESHFAYLNRSASEEVGRIRKTLEDWFSRYPLPMQADLRSRFRSSNDAQHEGAFFELALHELLRGVGLVSEAPAACDRATRPDFMLRSSTGSGEVFWEATVALSKSERVSAEAARTNRVYDVIERLDSPNFHLGIRPRGAPGTPPKATYIRRQLAQWLGTLDPDEVTRRFRVHGSAAFPECSFEHDGWRAVFFAIPKPEASRGRRGDRPVGVRFAELRRGAPYERPRATIIDKAKQHGELSGPYIVAVNVSDRMFRQRDAVEALFGTERVFSTMNLSGKVESRPSRAQDGVWINRQGITRTRVSAVLFVHGLSPWTLAEADMCLYLNPWAARPYPTDLWLLPLAEVRDDRVIWREGQTAARAFDLPVGWPFQ